MMNVVRTCSKCGGDVAGRFCPECGTEISEIGPMRMHAGILFLELLGDGVVDPQLTKELVHRAVAEHGGQVELVAAGAAVAVFVAPFAKGDPALALVRGADSLRSTLTQLPNLQWRGGMSYGQAVLDAGERNGFAGLALAGSARDAAAIAAPYQIVLDAAAARASARWTKTEPRRDDGALFVELDPDATEIHDVVGRELEMGQIAEMLEAIRRDRSARRLVLLGGPGVGKTRLVESAISSLGGRALAARAACPPQALSPLRPLEKIVMELAQLDPDSPAESLRERLREGSDGAAVAESVAALFGWARGSPGGAPYWGLRRLFEVIARFNTAIVVLDDVHWADEILLDAVDHLLAFLSSSPILFVFSARPDVVATRPHLGLGSTGQTVVNLDGLSPDDARALVERAAGGGVAPDVSQLIQQAAGGNPLFIVELVAHLKDAGYIGREDGEWRAREDLQAIPLAPGVQALIEARVASLDPGERSILEACSLQDVTFDAREVEIASQRPPNEVMTALVTLRQHAFIEIDSDFQVGADRFRFKHGLIQETAYEMAGKEQRAEMHLRLAGWVVDSGLYDDESERAGYHLETAYRLLTAVRPPGEGERAMALEAAQHLAQAGRTLAVRGHLPPAAGFLERALALYPARGTGWVNAAIDLAECYVEIGNYSAGYALLEEIDRVTEGGDDPVPRLRYEVSKVLADAATSFSDPQNIIDTAAKLVPRLETLGDNTAMSKLRRAEAEANWTRGRCAETTAALELAIYHSWMSPSQRLLPRAVWSMSAAMRWGPMPVGAAIHVCRRLLQLTGADPLVRAGVDTRLAALEALRGNFREARSLALASISMHKELGQLQQAAASTQDAGWVELLAGDAEEAARLFQTGLDELVDLGVPGFAATNAAFLGRALYELGRFDEAEEHIRLAHKLADDDPTLGADTLPVRALLAVERGDGVAALGYIDEARAEAGNTDMLPIIIFVEMDAAKVYAHQRMFGEALLAAQHAIALAKQKDATALLDRAEKVLAEVSP